MSKISFLLALCAASAALAQQPQAQPSRPLPAVTIKTPDAKGINLHKYRGKELILILFSTECEDCVTTIGYMNQIQTDLGPHGVQVVGIGVNKNAPYELGPWQQRYRPNFPMGFLDQESMLKLVAMPKDTVPYVPLVMFIDSSGIVRTQYAGNSPIFKDKSQAKALRAIAESLLQWQAAHTAKAAPKQEPAKQQ